MRTALPLRAEATLETPSTAGDPAERPPRPDAPPPLTRGLGGARGLTAGCQLPPLSPPRLPLLPLLPLESSVAAGGPSLVILLTAPSAAPDSLASAVPAAPPLECARPLVRPSVTDTLLLLRGDSA